MNILEEQDPQISLLNKCKVTYLQKQNAWMSKEVDFINSLIGKYKQIIQGQTQFHSPDRIQQIKEEIRQAVERKKEEYREIVKSKKEDRQEQITEDEFNSMVESYQQKIVQLQASIVDREKELQFIEDVKNKQSVDQHHRYNMKLLGSIQIHGKLIDKLRKENKKLKEHKKELENQLITKKEAKECQEETLPTAISKQSTSRFSKIQPEMSVFEKTVLILKKKRYSNDVLEERIAKMRKKIEQKKATNEHLKKELERQEWNCLEEIQTCNGYVQSNYNEQNSIFMKPSSQANLSFSLDISRFTKLPIAPSHNI